MSNSSFNGRVKSVQVNKNRDFLLTFSMFAHDVEILNWNFNNWFSDRGSRPPLTKSEIRSQKRGRPVWPDRGSMSELRALLVYIKPHSEGNQIYEIPF